MNRKLLAAIVANGDEYCRRYLSQCDALRLEKDWWQALDFFLARACFQGRRDEVSDRVYRHVRDVLQPLFSTAEADANFSRNKDDQWRSIAGQLRSMIGKGKVGKGRDVDMVLSVLSYIGTLPERNIVAHSVAQIRAGKLKQHYHQLQRGSSATGITQVGPKIAAFYLRDVVSVFGLTNCMDSTSAFCLQPVDTWVHQVAEKLGIVPPKSGLGEVQEAIASMCEKEHVCALRFNQGAWFTGSHAFELLLGRLSE